jgi:arginase family enzyme
MNLSHYLNAYTGEELLASKEFSEEHLYSFVDFYEPSQSLEVDSYDAYIIGVPEGRLSQENEACALAPDFIRKEFYNLYQGDWSTKLLDLGNLKIGETVQDTYFALQEIIVPLLEAGKVVIVLGGGHDLIVPIYKSHCTLSKPLNFASADAYFDFQDEDYFHSRAFLSKLISSKEALLQHYSILGYQSYLNSPKQKELLESMNFELLRLGDVKNAVEEVEPSVRDLDHLSVDLSVLRSADAPANVYSSPNGLSAEELCAVVRYAGMSNRLQSLLFSELNPKMDVLCSSSKLYAQALWCFIEGLSQRRDDFPDNSLNNFQRFMVAENGSTELIFYKSLLSGRWWIEIPQVENRLDRSLLPCSYSDYKSACEGDFSSRLLKKVF